MKSIRNSQILVLELLTIDRLNKRNELQIHQLLALQTLPPVPSPRAVRIGALSDMHNVKS
jgi:hypothetical protein